MFRIFLAINVVLTHSLPIRTGTAAVYLFFMLSGYWCYRMWWSEYQKTDAPYFVFAVSRIWRLIPLYLVAFLLLLAVYIGAHKTLALPAGSSALQAAHFYFSNIFILGMSRLPNDQRLLYQAWSLDIEIQFYLIMPLIIMALGSPRKTFFAIFLVAASLLCSAYFLAFYEGSKSASGYFPMYLIFFLIGIFSARFDWSPAKPWVYASVIAAAAFLFMCFKLHALRGLFLTGSFSNSIILYNPAGNFVLALLLAPYAMATVAVKIRNDLLRRIDRDLSNITYEVYLLHLAVLEQAAVWFPNLSRLGHYQQLPYMAGVYAAIAALSCALYYCLDRPLDSMRRAFVKSRIRLEARPSAAMGGIEIV